MTKTIVGLSYLLAKHHKGDFARGIAAAFVRRTAGLVNAAGQRDSLSKVGKGSRASYSLDTLIAV